MGKEIEVLKIIITWMDGNESSIGKWKPHKASCTFTALCEVANTLSQKGIETEIFWIENKPIGGCIACKACSKSRECVFDDVVNCFLEKAYEADGFIIGSPVHYAGASGNMTAFMDRLFCFELGGNGNWAFYMKLAAAVVRKQQEKQILCC